MAQLTPPAGRDAATAIPEIMPQLYKNIAKHGMNYTNFFTP